MVKIIGHIIGFCSIALFCLSVQVNDKRKIIVIQTIATIGNCLQYLLIGAYSGFLLNVVCVARNLIFTNKDKKAFSGKWIPYAMAGVMAILSAFSWEGYYSLFIIIGLMVNTICLGVLDDAQAFRKSTLISCPLVLIYNIFAGSYSGIVSEGISIGSSIVGIIRYEIAKKGKKAE